MKLALAGINDWIIEVFFGDKAYSEVGSMAWGSDGLFLFIWWVSVFFFVLLMGIMGYCMVVYRRKEGVPAERSASHNTPLEIAWSVIPSLLLAVMFFWGFNGYLRAQMAPSYAEQIDLQAAKWYWAMTYPTGISSTESTELGGSDVPVFYVPAETPVRLKMNSSDVIHSFWVPDFRTKLDVMPNRYTPYSFTALPIDRADERVEVGQDKDGSEYYYRDHTIYCAEYCGDMHSEMLAVLRVVEPSYYRKWVNTPPYDDFTMPVEVGELVWKAKCSACHSIDGSRMTGPTWVNAYGYPREFTNGEALTQQEIENDPVAWQNYIRESIIYPGAKIVAGYSNAMPSFDGQISDVELRGVTAYMQSLSDQYDGSPITIYPDLAEPGSEEDGGESGAEGDSEAPSADSAGNGEE